MNSLAAPINSLDHAGVARLLAPLSADAPCGPAARYDPVFTEIRLLREEDDPQLPMGQWERPLKRADWAAIEEKCIEMLAARSKDLQIAVWLVEAWMRQHGFEGLRQGLRMLDALLRSYWTQLHPRIDDDGAGDGDLDARLAPLEWLNESLGASVRVHTVLVNIDAGKPTPVTLADWERMTMREMAPDEPLERGKPAAPEAVLTRADVADGVLDLQAELAWMETAVEDCLEALAAIAIFLRTALAASAPSLGKLVNTLEAARRVLAQLHDSAAPAMPEDEALLQERDFAPAAPAAPAALCNIDPPGAGPLLAGAPWRNRKEAYATLEELANYLSEVEPHSPTPYLVRRAVNWGRLSLPEVIAEIIREDGDVSRLFNVLGMRL